MARGQNATWLVLAKHQMRQLRLLRPHVHVEAPSGDLFDPTDLWRFAKLFLTEAAEDQVTLGD
jgi:sucrose-6-phosphate hydrolase SacC (GH32 family)